MVDLFQINTFLEVDTFLFEDCINRRIHKMFRGIYRIGVYKMMIFIFHWHVSFFDVEDHFGEKAH